MSNAQVYDAQGGEVEDPDDILSVGPATTFVDPDAVYAYAKATQDLNPLYLEGVAVPPAFTANIMRNGRWRHSSVEPSGKKPLVGEQFGVHGGQDIFFHGVVQPGQELQWLWTVAGLKANRGGVVLTRRIMVSDMSGRPLVEHLWSNFHVGATINGPHPAWDPPDHTFVEEARARPFGVKTVWIDRDQAFRYAGVSKDHAPHAMEDVLAREEGYPGKILQGMCTFAVACGAVVDLAADGEPRRLRRFAGRFSAPAFPNRNLDVQLYDVGRTAEGARHLCFEALQDGVVVIKHGRVDVADERID